MNRFSSKQKNKRIANRYGLAGGLLVCFIIGTGLLGSSLAIADKKTVIKKYSAVARKSIDFSGGGELPQKFDFRFDNATAWLRENGEFGLEAEIKHNGLLCGDYEVGISFGIGSPACSNVSWITEPYYISSKKQCNNAWMIHAGGGVVADVTDDFAQISCAQLLIKCTGKCD
jgi:hypothetical protein